MGYDFSAGRIFLLIFCVGLTTLPVIFFGQFLLQCHHNDDALEWFSFAIYFTLYNRPAFSEQMLLNCLNQSRCPNPLIWYNNG